MAERTGEVTDDVLLCCDAFRPSWVNDDFLPRIELALDDFLRRSPLDVRAGVGGGDAGALLSVVLSVLDDSKIGRGAYSDDFVRLDRLFLRDPGNGQNGVVERREREPGKAQAFQMTTLPLTELERRSTHRPPTCRSRWAESTSPCRPCPLAATRSGTTE